MLRPCLNRKYLRANSCGLAFGCQLAAECATAGRVHRGLAAANEALLLSSYTHRHHRSIFPYNLRSPAHLMGTGIVEIRLPAGAPWPLTASPRRQQPSNVDAPALHTNAAALQNAARSQPLGTTRGTLVPRWSVSHWFRAQTRVSKRLFAMMSLVVVFLFDQTQRQSISLSSDPCLSEQLQVLDKTTTARDGHLVVGRARMPWLLSRLSNAGAGENCGSVNHAAVSIYYACERKAY